MCWLMLFLGIPLVHNLTNFSKKTPFQISAKRIHSTLNYLVTSNQTNVMKMNKTTIGID